MTISERSFHERLRPPRIPGMGVHAYDTKSHPRKVECEDCGVWWRYGCPDCALEFTRRHKRETGHNITIELFVGNWHSQSQVRHVFNEQAWRRQQERINGRP